MNNGDLGSISSTPKSNGRDSIGKKRGIKSPHRTSHAVRAALKAKLAAQTAVLPMSAAKDKVLELIASARVTILVGETGSGKTTQLPKFLLEGGLAGPVPEWGADDSAGGRPKKRAKAATGTCVAVTQPRRVAAVTIATRVAQEVGCDLGTDVGYTVRFDDTSSQSTRLKYMTDGMLLREALLDPELKRYGIIVLDEAHERTVTTDVLLGLVARLMVGSRPDLKVVVMSATLQSSTFADFFRGMLPNPAVDVATTTIPGRQHPVVTMYTQAPEADWLDAVVVAVMQVHLNEGSLLPSTHVESCTGGDILVFLTGQEEIESIQRILQDRANIIDTLRTVAPGPQREEALAAAGLPPTFDVSKLLRLVVTTIYAALPPEEQLVAFAPAPPGSRKVILATNIAETSITINGVRYVIDPGQVKTRVYQPSSGMDSLVTVPTSKSSAAQRAGRAGREAPGVALKLYPESVEAQLPAEPVAEILRSNLAHVLLMLKTVGVKDVQRFPFVQPPPRDTLIKSLTALLTLGALDKTGAVTVPLGKAMAALPLDPPLAKTLLVARAYGVLEEALSIASLLSVDGLWYMPKGKRDEAMKRRRVFLSIDGDHGTLLSLWHGWAAQRRASNRRVAEAKSWAWDHFLNFRALMRAEDIRAQLARIAGSLPVIPLPKSQQIVTSPSGPATSSERREAVLRAFLTGYCMQVAILQPDGTYMPTWSGSSREPVAIHPSSALFGRKPAFVVFHELVFTTKRYMRGVSSVEQEWVEASKPTK